MILLYLLKKSFQAKDINNGPREGAPRSAWAGPAPRGSPAGRGAQCGGERAMMSWVSQSLLLLLHNLFSHNIPISFENDSFLQVMNSGGG